VRIEVRIRQVTLEGVRASRSERAQLADVIAAELRRQPGDAAAAPAAQEAPLAGAAREVAATVRRVVRPYGGER
jgi:hypothetical protein